MAAFQNVDPALGVYFKKHFIPDIYEALIGGLLVMCPDDPLTFLEEKLKEIMEKGLHSILWNMCIDPVLSLRLKVISETYLHTLLGLDDDQLMTTELCNKAWYFYSTNLKRICFDAWIKYCALTRNTRETLQKKFSLARHFHERKLLHLIMIKWRDWVQFRRKQHERAAARIEKVFHCAFQKVILTAWKKQANFSKKAKRYVEHVEKGEASEFDLAEDNHAEVFERHHAEVFHLSEKYHSSRRLSEAYRWPVIILKAGKDLLTKLPDKALAQVFRHLNLIDLGRCAQVSRSWNAMTRISLLWSNINFSAVKDKVRDNDAGNILLKWHTIVVHLNLRGCATLQWYTFKNIGHCKNLQELNVSECQGLNGLPQLTIFKSSLLQKIHRQRFTVPQLWKRMSQAHLFGYFRLPPDSFEWRVLAGTLSILNPQRLQLAAKAQTRVGTKISVEGFRNIAKSCSGVQHLTINEMPTLTDRCIQALVEKCPQIATVECNESPHVSDIAFKTLSECKLVKIKIEGSNRITDLSFKLMSKFWPDMKRICVADCQKITDTGLKLISALHDIVILNVSDCMRISDTGVKAFVEGSSGPSIRELILANCSSITDISLTKIVQRCSKLIYLNVRYCQAVTDAGIEALSSLSSLAYINISGTNITDQALDSLGKHGRIKEIIISECKNISDSGIKKFCIDMKKLEYIDFSYCQQLSNHSLKHLSFGCRRLTSVSVAGCSKVTDIGIQFLSTFCTYLHYLDISGCISITDKALKCLWKGCLQLRILKMLYCTNIPRQAVLKFSPRLQKYEYNDDDPPLWFGYDSSGRSFTPKKQKKSRLTVGSPAEKSSEQRRPSMVSSLGEKNLELRSPTLNSPAGGSFVRSISSIIDPPPEKSSEHRPVTVDPPAEN
ncbi:dynein regulatory complex subunit 6 isoform X2 [Hemicordylus capensis]|uniref:dynein regulatory complex subunit 6 isoform X2 n=1 Tax=Hemicordylus capensis TaxID=884348 RepID=UPI002304C398|nr:dynein regulatory complex subunit 6 isoform X2 [Hemicordylus capensis]